MLLAYGFLRKIFEVFEKYKTPIDMVTTSEVAVSVTIDNGANMNKILRELEPFGTTDVEYDQTIVSIVGNEIVETRDVLGKIFEALSQVPVRMVSYGGSKHNVSVLIPSSFKINTLQALNKKLFGLE
jgi:aspartate kinase